MVITLVQIITPINKLDLSTYKFNRVAKAWFKKQKEGKYTDVGSMDRDGFLAIFLDKSFPHQLRNTKVEDFIN